MGLIVVMEICCLTISEQDFALQPLVVSQGTDLKLSDVKVGLAEGNQFKVPEDKAPPPHLLSHLAQRWGCPEEVEE